MGQDPDIGRNRHRDRRHLDAKVQRGKITFVSEIPVAGAAGAADPIFVAHAALARGSMLGDDLERPVLSHLRVSADLDGERRSILDWLLSTFATRAVGPA